MELPFLFLNLWKLKSSVIVSRSSTSCLQKLLTAGEAVHNYLSVGPFPGTEVFSQVLVAAPGQDARSSAFRYLRLVRGCGSLQLGGVYSRSSPRLSVIKQLSDGKSGSWRVGRGVAAGLREVCTKRPFPACLRALCRFPWVGMLTLSYSRLCVQLFTFVCVMLHGPLGEKHQLGRLSSYWNTMKNSEFSEEFFLARGPAEVWT